MESFCRGNPKGVMNYFRRFNYIVADEYHYLLTDAAINKYIDLSYVTLNELTKYRPVIFMSATAHPFFHRWRDETNEALPENYYHIPSDYSYVERAVFYWTDAEEIKIIRQEARRGEGSGIRRSDEQDKKTSERIRRRVYRGDRHGLLALSPRSKRV